MPNLPATMDHLRLPAVAAPLFIISNPDLVIAQCKAGIVGSFPALNARGDDDDGPELERWLIRITEELDRYNQKSPDAPAAPFAVNQIVNRTNTRLERDVELCVKYKVPIWITSLGARADVFDAAHAAGGVAFHDIINNTFAKKAISKGADGLIAVASGAGGHAGTLSPFALIQEIRDWFDGPLLLSGSIATGRAVLAAQAMGADLGYIGSAFISCDEANAVDDYKDMIVSDCADDITYSNLFTGVHGNYLRNSIVQAGMDPDNLAEGDVSTMNFAAGSSKPKAWKNIWGAGQGIGAIDKRMPTSEFVARLISEYNSAKQALTA